MSYYLISLWYHFSSAYNPKKHPKMLPTLQFPKPNMAHIWNITNFTLPKYIWRICTQEVSYPCFFVLVLGTSSWSYCCWRELPCAAWMVMWRSSMGQVIMITSIIQNWYKCHHCHQYHFIISRVEAAFLCNFWDWSNLFYSS